MKSSKENTNITELLELDPSTFGDKEILIQDKGLEESSLPLTGEESEVFRDFYGKKPDHNLKKYPNYRVVRNPILKKDKKFVTLQLWDGYIEAFDDKKGCIIARLSDKTAGGSDEIAEIPYEDISENDIDLMKPGALFIFSIGYMQNESGQRFKTSNIKFKRFPRITKEQITAAKTIAETLSLRRNEDDKH